MRAKKYIFIAECRILSHWCLLEEVTMYFPHDTTWDQNFCFLNGVSVIGFTVFQWNKINVRTCKTYGIELADETLTRDGIGPLAAGTLTGG